MIILHAEDLKKVLPMDQTITAMKSAYAASTSGHAEFPLRTRLDVSRHGGTCLFMPSYVHDEGGDTIALKAVAVYPTNSASGIPIIHAAVLVMEGSTGKPVALLEGSSLTAIRTGAASGAASDLLAKPDAKTAAIFGAGVQGKTQLAAVCTVRKITTAWIYDIDPNRAQTLVDELRNEEPIPNDLRVASSPSEAASQADIVCTATTSLEPVYPAEAIQPGTHINGVGSYTLEMVENPPDLIMKARLFVDSREAALAEAGDFAAPIRNNDIEASNFTEIGSVILGRSEGRISQEEITFFKSVGIAVQDALAARLALDNARIMGLGQQVDW